MTFYPVVIPTLNRFEHLKNCIESLKNNTHYSETDLIIALDYPPSDKYFSGWEKIKLYIKNISGFKSVQILERKENFGALKNCRELINYACEKYGACIFTEDDNIFSPCFLDYMNKCLDYYKSDKTIMTISGYKPYWFNSLSDYNSSHFKIKAQVSGWGIGLWKDRYDEFQNGIPENFRKYIFGSRKRLWKLRRYMIKLNHIYFWILANPELDNVCDFTQAAYMALTNKYSIYPKVSLVRNNGNDGSGEHCGVNDIFKDQEISESLIFNFLDNISKKDVKRYSEYMKRRGISVSEYLKTLLLVTCYFILGYDLSEKIIQPKTRINRKK